MSDYSLSMDRHLKLHHDPSLTVIIWDVFIEMYVAYLNVTRVSLCSFSKFNFPVAILY